MSPPLLQLFDEASAAYRNGNLAQAQQLCQQINRSHPEQAQSWYLLAMIAHRQAKSQLAANHIGQAIKLAPDSAEIQTHAAEIFRRAKRLDACVASAREAVRLSPQHPATHNNLGMGLQDQGELTEAEACFRQAIAVDGRYPKAHHNLGNVLLLQGRLEDAAQILDELLRLRPDDPQALNAMGLVRSRQQRHREALALLEKSIRLRPGYRQAQLNLCNTLAELDRLDEAEQCLRDLLRKNSQYTQAWHDLGSLMEKRHRMSDALQAYLKAVTVEPDSHQSLAAMENVKRRICDWSGRPQCIEHLLRIVRDCVSHGKTSPLWPLASLRFPTDSMDRLAIAREYARAISARIGGREFHPTRNSSVQNSTTVSPVSTSGSGGSRGAGGGEVLRIGVLSHEFRHCVVSHLMAGLFRRFDRQQFEIIGFDYSPDDASQLRRQVAADCDQFIPISDLTPYDAAERIADQQIHILFDINSYMPGGRPEIAAHRPAPIQVSYMYPAPMGAPWIDYFLTDRYVTPTGHEQFFTEKLVYLPDAYLPTNRDQPIADHGPSRTECGLPEQGFVFCSFNSADKIEPELFDVWMRILHATPGSVLWQRCDESIVQENLRNEAQARDIDPDRLIFAPPVADTADHLARHRHADLFLDTLTHGGHGTTVDALWAEVPVITCPGDTFTSRVSASLLTTAGLTELIASDLTQYEQMALQFAHHPDQLRHVRQKLQSARETSPLFDTTRLVRNLETALLAMWQCYRSRQVPATIKGNQAVAKGKIDQ